MSALPSAVSDLNGPAPAPRPPSTRARIAVACLAAVWGVLCLFQMARGTDGRPADFDVVWHGARVLLSGDNPYTAICHGCRIEWTDHLYYPATALVAVAPLTGDELAGLAMEVFRANHGTLRRSLLDPDLQLVHRLLGSDSPLQGELLSYLMFDPDFFEAAADLGRREAEDWLTAHPDLWRTDLIEPLASTP